MLVFFLNSHLAHVIWCHLSEYTLLFIFTIQIFHSLFLLLPVSKHDCLIFTISSTHLISISDNDIFSPFSSFYAFSCSFYLNSLLFGNILKVHIINVHISGLSLQAEFGRYKNTETYIYLHTFPQQLSGQERK